MAEAAKQTTNADWRKTDPGIVDRLLEGAVDLHCHSGPSVMPRELDHIEAMRDAAEAKFRAVLIKDHYYSATPITELLNAHFSDLGVMMMSGVPLNNPTGGLNRYSVDHGIKLGAKLVWMPTFSAANHIAHHKKEKENFNFPTTREKLLEPMPLTILDEDGKLLDEVKIILDLIAEADIVLSGGHLHISEIWPLFEEAQARGVKRLLVNHPTFVVDASMQDIRALTNMGAYVEHSVCMFIDSSRLKMFEPENLGPLIDAGTIDKTIMGSDLGQIDNARPVPGFRNVIETLLDMGYAENDIRKMVSQNACDLMGLS